MPNDRAMKAWEGRAVCTNDCMRREAELRPAADDLTVFSRNITSMRIFQCNEYIFFVPVFLLI